MEKDLKEDPVLNALHGLQVVRGALLRIAEAHSLAEEQVRNLAEQVGKGIRPEEDDWEGRAHNYSVKALAKERSAVRDARNTDIGGAIETLSAELDEDGLARWKAKGIGQLLEELLVKRTEEE